MNAGGTVTIQGAKTAPTTSTNQSEVQVGQAYLEWEGITRITKIIRIEAAHRLDKHNGHCSNLHGHSYKVEVTLEGSLNTDYTSSTYGMIKDFGDVKKDLQQVIGKHDHTCLNDDFLYPTAERMALTWLTELLAIDIRYCEVKVWETDDSYATASR
jgi:6-pyruvoyltetrahydropterin/6-carboxytetrahydropterin synthase